MGPRSAFFQLIALVFLHLSNSQDGYIRGRGGLPRTQPCETGSCYPATGNLLIGRENKLSASSTCGLEKQERFCIVSHLEEKKKCFWCDSRPHTRGDPHLNHEISNIVYNNPRVQHHVQPWWQSENGKEDVYVQLDMEAEFHFTHLVITFKTFRPAAMLIERSQDKGRTWQVYQYFASDCNEAFPNVSIESRKDLNDVVCDSRYSRVDPSSGGQLIFRVIPPSIQVDDPFAPEVQELVKMTNLRINFTKLHTLGDNLLDKRSDIQEKYYYAINNMIVRGSCSCYGHANRCLPLPDEDGRYTPPDMVHGQCECTHNTKGRNCESCEDFYNDLPWKPAFGKSQNACKRCNCNNHSAKCHFDQAVYEMSGNVTGGVCENCEHNTQGNNCEECIPFYYHDPQFDITHPLACQPCDCDPRGSLDDGICDPRSDVGNEMVAGRCHCKKNVGGMRCDGCKSGFWNFDQYNPDGCQACRCDVLGTADQHGCDVNTGGCTCKRYVTGRECNQCQPEYYGLSDDRNGCKPCDCFPGGSFDNSCDVISGQCRCRPGVSGRKCDQPLQEHFVPPLDFLIYEAELAKTSPDVQVAIREPYRDGTTTWTGTGFARAGKDSEIEFLIDQIKTSREYDILVRYEPQLPGGWSDVDVILERFEPIDPSGPCANSISESDEKRIRLPGDSYTYTLDTPLCLEENKQYKLKFRFKEYDPQQETPSASVLIDSIVLFPRPTTLPFFHGNQENEYKLQEFENYRCAEHYLSPVHNSIPDLCEKYLYSIGFEIYNGSVKCDCDPTGSKSALCNQLGGNCECKPNIVGRNCDRCAPGTFGFGPEGCTACDCNSLALDNFCDQVSGQCKCRPNTYGRECDQCQPGFWNFPNCQRCECNGHADKCHPKTGACTNCRDFTESTHCDVCIEGYYGDPRLGFDIPCRPCPCPGIADTGNSFAPRCNLDPNTLDVVCECNIGYAGFRCEVCADNYFGNPEAPGGSCQPCDCNNNIDISRPGNCDSLTGHCLQCLFNTQGTNCERCKDTFYGDAIHQQCTECVCDELGKNQSIIGCDQKTGQCPCLPNVTGLTCAECEDNHWKIASGSGCEACDCDPIGSDETQCNIYDGQCTCKPGFGSRRCDQCQTNYWGDPNVECHKCECNLEGSETMQCNRNNGTCICLPGIGGDKCDQCARGYLSEGPVCTFCGECFKNWDDILEDLKEQTERMMNAAAEIRHTGVHGAYTQKFQKIKEQIDDTKSILQNTSLSAQNLTALQETISSLRDQLTASTSGLNEVVKSLEDTEQRIKRVDLNLNNLKDEVDVLREEASLLKNNATKLQEANVEGALNLTRDAQRKSQNAIDVTIASAELDKTNAERQCKRTMALYNRTVDHVFAEQTDNEKALTELTDKLDDLKKRLPDLNEKVCGKADEECSDLCGGAGCGFCGGLSCELGAVEKAKKSENLVVEAEKAIKEKEGKAEELLRSVTQAKHEAVASRNSAQNAYETAKLVDTKSEEASKESALFIDKRDKFLNTPGAKSSEIRKLAEETQSLRINQQPEQISDLVKRTESAVHNLTNIDTILEETNDDKARVAELKERANKAKIDSENILNTAQKVTVALDEAESAQRQADDAIRTANKHITLAENDLTQIESESKEAQAKVNETSSTVQNLNERLKDLQKKFIQNQVGAEEIKKVVDNVSDDAGRSSLEVGKLKEIYINVEDSLSKRTGQRNTAKDKAQKLLDLASQLYVTTDAKEKELKALESNYYDQEKELNALLDEMSDLSSQMDNYISRINDRSKYYSTCTS